MWDFLRRWHPLVLLFLAIYMAIPKPAPNPAEVDEEFLKANDKDEDGVISKEEFKGMDFELRDKNSDGKLTVGSMFKWPLHAYQWNLGQDLKGGSSLRYVLVQQDMVDAEGKLRELMEPLQDSLDKLSPEARAKFEGVIKGGEFKLGQFKRRENSDEKDDFDLLQTTGVFDEGRVDAARRYYHTWESARQRKEDKSLVGPTIETLNRRLGATGMTELTIAPLGESRLEVKLPKFSSPAETQRFKDLLQTTGKLEMRLLAAETSDFAGLEVGQYPKDEGYKYKWLELAKDDATRSALVKERDGKKYVPVMVIDEYDVTGKDLGDVQGGTDRQGGLAVDFSLKGLAVANFERLTERHRQDGEDPRLMAVVIDDKVYSAYSISEKISGNVQLSGKFTSSERDDIINVLKSGSLNVKLELEGEESVGPSEGAEAVKRGMLSFIIAAVFVFLFALWLYRGLGVLVIFNLLMIIALIMGAMSAGLGTLTLPGIAGLVLTFGMAIDGNILINERMREELKRGLSQRSAAEEGFKNAFSAIVDSNITTLLTALILYKLGSGPVQGFALALAIGIVATLYANIPAYRAMIFGVLNLRRDTKFSMTSLSFLENRKINFVAGMKIMVPICAVLTIVGLGILLSLGGSVLGMEFRGGHAFRVQMKQGYDRAEIADKLMDENAGTMRVEWARSVDVQPVFTFGGADESGKAARFDIRFPMDDSWEGRDQNEVNKELRARLTELFKDEIAPEGWRARPVEVRELNLRAELKLKLKDPAKFREAHAEDFEKLWLVHDRAWRNNPNAPVENKDKWFGDVLKAGTTAKVVTDFKGLNAAGDRQTLVVSIDGLPVTDGADIEQKNAAFREALRRWFWADSTSVDIDGEPAVTEVPVKARMALDLAFVQPVKVDDLRAFFTGLGATVPELGTGIVTVEPVAPDAGNASAFTIRTGELSFSAERTSSAYFGNVEGAINGKLTDWLKKQEPKDNYISNPFLLASAIGAVVAADTQVRAMLAIAAALLVLVIYMRWRFAGLAWGVAAIVALAFDVTVALAGLAVADLLGADMKIDLVVVAAILTVIGYAINDTIVNFDRIRESLRADRLATGGKTPLKDIINESANLMLPRTLMTGGTTLTSTLIMLIFGGPLLQAFAFTIFIGVIMGTFASVFIASPVLLLFGQRGREELLDLTEEEREGKKEEDKAAPESADAPVLTDESDKPADKPAEPAAEKPADKPAEPAPEKKDEGQKS
ncbi:MAG: protein translocase subunit SecD [Planctomycetes bacterium]|nr:protein translocase subunit SecD [Planctomycetota bacterium]